MTKTIAPRTRRTTVALLLASVALGGTLTACGSEAENTTCGELKGMSDDETIKFVRDAAEDDGSDNADDAIKAIDSLPDDETAKKAFADTIKGLCDGKDDDTKLKDTNLYE